jgi:hypothetical protein
MINPPHKLKVNNLVSALPDNTIPNPKNGLENRRYSEKSFKLKNQTQNLKDQNFSGSDKCHRINYSCATANYRFPASVWSGNLHYSTWNQYAHV